MTPQRLLVAAAAVVLRGESLASQTPRVGIEAGTVSFCSAQVLSWWRGLGNGGRITCAKDPTRPVILLVHGLHQNITTWTAPSAIGYSYDVSRDPGPERVGDSHQEPGIGVYKIGTSPWAYGNDAAQWDRDHNWFDYLVALGFTVASWSQPGTSFQDAVPSAMLAFDSLLAQTKARNPGAPPPVALIGHSRGGLVIRKILKDRRTATDIARVKWVVTLHTPHQGSQLGEFPGRLVAETIDLMDCCAPASLTGPLKTQLKNVVTEAMRPMTKILVDFESRELTANSPMFRDLTNGETQLPGVKYFTFGGVNPTFYRLYSWVFDATSAVPQFKNASQYFVWHVNPVALTPVSPVLDKIRPFVREVQAGYGDGLVTDASSRLPWSTHFTDHLNHAEVLWDRPLQTRVAQLIDQLGQSKPTKPE